MSTKVFGSGIRRREDPRLITGTATYTDDIGDAMLSAVWTDPAFDPAAHAFYYVRLLQIPTPRWSTYDAKALGVEPRKDLPV